MTIENDKRLQHAINATLKAVVPFGITNDEEGQATLGSVLSGVFLAYEAGVRMGIENAPIETTEVAYRTRVTPQLLEPMTRDGWDPWALTEVVVPPDPTKRGVQQSAPGWLVRFKRKAPAPAQEGQS